VATARSWGRAGAANDPVAEAVGETGEGGSLTAPLVGNLGQGRNCQTVKAYFGGAFPEKLCAESPQRMSVIPDAARRQSNGKNMQKIRIGVEYDVLLRYLV
jgi:hypothetical protein